MILELSSTITTASLQIWLQIATICTASSVLIIRMLHIIRKISRFSRSTITSLHIATANTVLSSSRLNSTAKHLLGLIQSQFYMQKVVLHHGAAIVNVGFLLKLQQHVPNPTNQENHQQSVFMSLLCTVIAKPVLLRSN
jgi:hypothetical protein